MKATNISAITGTTVALGMALKPPKEDIKLYALFLKIPLLFQTQHQQNR